MVWDNILKKNRNAFENNLNNSEVLLLLVEVDIKDCKKSLKNDFVREYSWVKSKL